MPVRIGLLAIVSFSLARSVNRHIYLSTARAELGRQRALHLAKRMVFRGSSYREISLYVAAVSDILFTLLKSFPSSSRSDKCRPASSYAKQLRLIELTRALYISLFISTL